MAAKREEARNATSRLKEPRCSRLCVVQTDLTQATTRKDNVKRLSYAVQASAWTSQMSSLAIHGQDPAGLRHPLIVYRRCMEKHNHSKRSANPSRHGRQKWPLTNIG
jgi:hypothetical protein